MMNKTHLHTLFRSIAVGLALSTLSSVSVAGDFSNPTPISTDSLRQMVRSSETTRVSAGSGSLPTYYTLGDYYERYQSGTASANSVLSGNTIILNGDNNTVTMTMDNVDMTQSADGACVSTTNTYNDASGSDVGVTTDCGLGTP